MMPSESAALFERETDDFACLFVTCSGVHCDADHLDELSFSSSLRRSSRSTFAMAERPRWMI